MDVQAAEAGASCATSTRRNANNSRGALGGARGDALPHRGAAGGRADGVEIR